MGVSCATADMCIAVGGEETSTGEQPLAEQWNGVEWTALTISGVAKDNYLTSVSCAGAQWCAAVGSSISKKAVQRALVEVWDGSSWTIDPTPLPGGPTSTAGLDSVSCLSATACTAVGAFARPGRERAGAAARRSLERPRLDHPTDAEPEGGERKPAERPVLHGRRRVHGWWQLRLRRRRPVDLRPALGRIDVEGAEPAQSRRAGLQRGLGCLVHQSGRLHLRRSVDRRRQPVRAAGGELERLGLVAPTRSSPARQQ